MQLLLPYEVWRDIKGYEGLYQISARGNVKSLPKTWVSGRYNSVKCHNGMRLKPGTSNTGYKIVVLCSDNGKKSKSVHRLLATAFIPNPKNKRYVNHIDSDRANNDIVNIEWATPSENSKHGWDYGFHESSEKQSKAAVLNLVKASEMNKRKVINIKTGEIFDSIKSASLINGIRYSFLSYYLKDKNSHKSNFRYLDLIEKTQNTCSV